MVTVSCQIYIINNKEYCRFACPRFLGDVLTRDGWIFHTTSRSMPINALLGYQCTRLFVDGI
jgi:hypothetical protein